MCQTYLDLGVVGNGGLTILAGYCHLEYTKVVLGHGGGVTVPAVEVANEVGSQGVRGPFAVYDVAIFLHVDAESFVALEKRLARFGDKRLQATYPGELLETTFCLVDRLYPVLCL